MSATTVAHGHSHEDTFRAVSFALSVPLDKEAFLLFAAGLPRSVLRAKGIIRLCDHPGRWLFQLVGRRHELTPADGAGSDDRLVFLGTPEMPDEAALRDLL